MLGPLRVWSMPSMAQKLLILSEKVWRWQAVQKERGYEYDRAGRV